MSKYYCPCCFGHHAEGTEHCKAFSHIPSLEGIEHVEKCLNDEGVITPWISSTPEGCPLCKGTGTITRQAEWRDIDILYWLTMLTRLEAWITAWITDETRDVKGKSLLTTKSGGRLRVREKD